MGLAQTHARFVETLTPKTAMSSVFCMGEVTTVLDSVTKATARGGHRTQQLQNASVACSMAAASVGLIGQK